MMNKTKHFKHLRELQEQHLETCTREFEKMNYEIIFLIQKYKRLHGYEIARMLKISQPELRKHILDIRLNFHKYVNPSNKKFLLADDKGYSLSDNKKQKKIYLKMLKEASIKKNIQALELEFTL